MQLTDVRRLTGKNLILDGPGAVGEAQLDAGRGGLAVALWRRYMRAMLEAIGWQQEVVRVRSYTGGASLAVSAPLDGLYVATDLIEWAWGATTAVLEGKPAGDLETAAAEFRAAIAKEASPQLIALAAAAAEKGTVLLVGEDQVSLGLGRASRLWPEDDLPQADQVPWSALDDVPLAMVTGTNGKSTTVRLTAAIAAAAGHTVGQSSSDWVRVGDEIIDEGDYSGPSGARQAVRDPRVDLAVLEVARGGLLRRGLAIPRADACAITNVSADHLGEYGVVDLASLVEAKFLIAKAVRPGGRLVLNADDPELVRYSVHFPGEITWFSLCPAERGISAWLAAGGEAAYLDDGQLVLAKGNVRREVLSVTDLPIGLKGAARYNLANALAAIALASALGLPHEAMARGLAGFRGSPAENPGRGNFLEIGGATFLVDFAHNPDGVAALIDAVRHLPAKRRLILLGQAGDRRDEDIRALVRVAWQARPERIIVKELVKSLRGRAKGEVPALIRAELESLGAPADAVGAVSSELEALEEALAWAKPGDLLILLLHNERKAALARLQNLQAAGWVVGERLPSV